MTIDKSIRAWEDCEYRESLSDEERALLPEDPVGQIELTEDELAKLFGGIIIRTHNPTPNVEPIYQGTTG